MRRSFMMASSLLFLACGERVGGGGGAARGGGPGHAGPGADGAAASGITITVEPTGSHGAPLVAAIEGATRSIHMEMYLLTLGSVASALAAKAAAGLDVKVILNETFPPGAAGSNDAIMAELRGAGVDAVWASPAFAYAHAKAIVVDGATAWIMTGNATASAYDSNREYLAVDTAPAHVAQAEALFAGDFAQGSYAPGDPGSTPAVPGALVVAPDPPMNALSALVSLLSSATRSVYAEVEEIDDTRIARAFVAAAGNGASVDLVVADTSDNTGSNQALSAIEAGGGRVYVGGAPESSSTQSDPYIHAKAVVVDGATAWVGSENFTTGSLEYNREIGVVFTAPGEVAKVLAAIQRDVASGRAR